MGKEKKVRPGFIIVGALAFLLFKYQSFNIDQTQLKGFILLSIPVVCFGIAYLISKKITKQREYLRILVAIQLFFVIWGAWAIIITSLGNFSYTIIFDSTLAIINLSALLVYIIKHQKIYKYILIVLNSINIMLLLIILIASYSPYLLITTVIFIALRSFSIRELVKIQVEEKKIIPETSLL